MRTKALTSIFVRLALIALPGLGCAQATGGGAAFVGNFGEVLKVSTATAIDAAMRSGKEVVLFYPKTLAEKPELDKVKPADFSRDGLLELLVTPRAGSKITSLPALCELRRQSLKQEQAVFSEYHCHAGEGCGIVGIDWPAETCQFDVTAPYKIRQIFTARDDAWFQLSSGLAFEAPEAYDIAHSVMQSVNPPAQTPAEVLPRYDAAPPSWSMLAPERPWPQLWLFLNGLLLIMAVLPAGPWRRRRALIGAWAIALGNAFVVVGLLYSAIGLAFKAGPLNNLSILAWAFSVIPPICIILWARRTAANPKAVGIAALAAALPLAALAFFARTDRPELPAIGGPFVSYIVLSLAGLLQGLVVGATVRPSEERP